MISHQNAAYATECVQHANAPFLAFLLHMRLMQECLPAHTYLLQFEDQTLTVYPDVDFLLREYHVLPSRKQLVTLTFFSQMFFQMLSLPQIKTLTSLQISV